MPLGTGNSPRIIALKDATRDAIEAAGGLEFCETETRCGKSQLARSYSPHDEGTISIRDALALDRLSATRGGPFITRALARQLGHVLIALPPVDADAQGVSEAVMRVTKELGDVTAEVLPATADGTVDQHEARRILPEAHQMAEQVSLLIALLTSIAYPGDQTGEAAA